MILSLASYSIPRTIRLVMRFVATVAVVATVVAVDCFRYAIFKYLYFC